MTAFFLSLGYVGLFLVSFLAATVLPLTSEVMFVAMPALGYDIWIVFLVANAGSILGSVTNYFLGLKGGGFVLSRYVTVDPRKLARATDLYQRWGPVIVFFAWLPVIGDPLTIVAGVFRLQFRTFAFWMSLGKVFRYLLLVALLTQVLPLSAPT